MSGSASSASGRPAQAIDRARGRRLARLLVIAAVQLALALVLAEIGLRFFRPAPRGDSRLLRYDAELGYLLAPNLDLVHYGGDYRMRVSTDDNGARRHPSAPAADRADLTVLAVGDSYTFSTGVDDNQTYPYFLEQALARRLPERRVHVVNLGVGGYGLTQARLMAARHMERLDPDLMMMMMCSNDPGDDLGFQLGHDHSRGLYVDPAAWQRDPTELRRYFDLVLKKLDLWRPLWLPAWRVPVRGEQLRRWAPTYPELVDSEFESLARLSRPRPVITSLINYDRLAAAGPGATTPTAGSLPALERELLAAYLAAARGWTRHVSLAAMEDGLFEDDGAHRRSYWNPHSGGHLSPRGNRAVAEFLAPALIRELQAARGRTGWPGPQAQP